MAIMPGVQWRPLSNPSKTRMAAYDIVCIHTMVGSLEGTDGYFRRLTNGINSHFGTGGDGAIRQWVDTAVRSGANGNGNHRIISIENADMGPQFPAWNTNDGAAVPPFTPAQIEANARICAWAHKTHGIPLTLIPDSKPGRRGIGFHRLGVPGYAVTGGELWSSSAGKVCPAHRRILQVPQIIDRAEQIVNGDDDMPLSDADIQKIKHALMDAPVGGVSSATGLPRIPNSQDVMLWQVVSRIANEVAAPMASRVPGSGYRDTVLGYAANADAYGNAISKQLAGLQGAVSELTKSLTAVAAGQDLDADELVARIDSTIADRMASVVSVRVSVDNPPKAGA